ncbi:hypothetical protein ABT294_15170 [Nonomuraea sp. NPDC000554]
MRTPRSWLPTTSWLVQPSSAAYQEALAALADGVERDFRIIEGLD